MKSLRLVAGPGILLRQSSNGTVISAVRHPDQDTLPPFTVKLFGNATDGYKVTVTEGYVIERYLTAGESAEALFYHPCYNRLTSGKPTEFTLAIGEAIYVSVSEDEYGAIIPGAYIGLVVDDTAAVSTNHIPSIQEGLYLYKLAELVADGGTVKLKNHAAGSHIYQTSGLTCDVRVMRCGVYPEFEANQYFRLSFLSGRIVELNADIEDRPLAATYTQNNVEHCT